MRPGAVLDLAEKLWTGAISTEEHSPMAPLLALDEVAPGVAFVSSFANVTALATGDGLVLFDTGSQMLARQVHVSVREWRTDARLDTAVFTHGHADHVFGVDIWEEESRAHDWRAPRVVAHAAVPARFARYQKTRGYNACVNRRQFQTDVVWPAEWRYPDETYEGSRVLDVGGLRVELHHARGETDDHTWAWIPEKRVLCTGDLFIWATPNAGNPQKVQRYPAEWALALRAMAAVEAEVLCPGHGLPIVGTARVSQALLETAELLESLVAQTLELMNAGATLDDVLGAVRAPKHLLERPYLRPVYDEPEFVVRNVWRLYGGWWDGNPARLKPARDAELAREVASLAGGAERLAARAVEVAAKGDYPLACHLIEWAAQAAPAAADVQRERRRIYEARAKRETSLMAKGVFRGAAKE